MLGCRSASPRACGHSKLDLATAGAGTTVLTSLGGSARGNRQRVLASGPAGSLWGAPILDREAAVEGLTLALAVDHGRDGIRVNAVVLCTALIATDPSAGLDEELVVLNRSARPGRPDELTAPIASLLSDQASIIAGAVVRVDDGRFALGSDAEAT